MFGIGGSGLNFKWFERVFSWTSVDVVFFIFVLKTTEKELYYTNNKLISKLDIYFDLSPSQFNDIMIKYTKLI